MINPAPLIDDRETDIARQHRIAWETRMIAQARASADAGLIDEAEIDAWIDSLGTENERLPPRLGR